MMMQEYAIAGAVIKKINSVCVSKISHVWIIAQSAPINDHAIIVTKNTFITRVNAQNAMIIVKNALIGLIVVSVLMVLLLLIADVLLAVRVARIACLKLLAVNVLMATF